MYKALTKNKSISSLKVILEDDLVTKLMKTASVVFLGNTGASALNFVTFTIVVNRLGTKLLAIFVLTQTFIMIINAIFNIQTWESVVKFGHSDSSERRLEDVVKVNFLMDMISAMIAFFAAVLLVKPSVEFFIWDPIIINSILIYSITIPLNLTTFKIGIPRLFDKFSVVAKVQIYTSALKFILVLPATFSSHTLIYYVVIFTAIEVLNSSILILYSIYLLKQHGHAHWIKGKIRRDPDQMRFIWWTNLRSIMRIPVQYCDMVVISMVMPLETVGIYKVYKEISGLLSKVGDPINQAIFPEYSKLIGNNNDSAAASLAKKTIYILLAVSSILSLGLILTSKYIVIRFYGNEFMPSIHILYILIGLMGVTIFTLPINALFVAAGFAKLGFYIVVFTNILYLSVSFVFGKQFGLYGIIAAYGLQMLFNQGLKVFFLKKYRMGWKDTIR